MPMTYWWKAWCHQWWEYWCRKSLGPRTKVGEHTWLNVQSHQDLSPVSTGWTNATLFFLRLIVGLFKDIWKSHFSNLWRRETDKSDGRKKQTKQNYFKKCSKWLPSALTHFTALLLIFWTACRISSSGTAATMASTLSLTSWIPLNFSCSCCLRILPHR